MPETFQKLLVVALRPEWSFLKQKYSFIQDKQLKNLYHISSHPGAALLQIGVGKESAEKNFLEFLTRHTAMSALHFGTSGALVPELKTGDAVVVTEVVCFDLESQRLLCEKLDTSNIPRSKLRDSKVVEGRLFTACAAVAQLEEKQAIAQKTGTIVVDMESYFVARLCRDKGIRYCSVRGIFDRMCDDIDDLNVVVDAEGSAQVNLFKYPKLILKIPMLKKKMGLVNRAMGEVVESFLLA